VERKRVLRTVVPATSASVLYADAFDGKGSELYWAVCCMDLEGIVAKRKDGLYTPEATTWVKIKNPHYSQLEGRREWFEKRSWQHRSPFYRTSSSLKLLSRKPRNSSRISSSSFKTA
jgi:hypothetical protein